jgi:hypothetical protein
MSLPAIHSTFGGDAARARRTDPETSHEAADLNDVNASIGAVLDTLTQYGPLADHELHTLMESLGYPYTPERVRTARAALVQRARVVHTGDYRMTPRNRRTRVWAVSIPTEGASA